MWTDERADAALAGLRVVEWSGGALSTRFAARLFADFGAEVLQAAWHEPEPGDPVNRAIGTFADAGKKTLARDDRAARAAVSRADVLIHAGGCELPESVEEAVRENASLVRTVVAALGESDGFRSWCAEALQVCALSGVSAALGEEGRFPLHLPFAIPALQASFHAVAATLVALAARDEDGLGQRVEVAAADVLASYAAGMNLFVEGAGGRWTRRGFDRHGPIYPSGFYPCADGFVIIAAQSRKPWLGFLRLMGDPEWAENDPELRDGVAIGAKRADEVDVHFIAWLVEHTRAELVEKARAIDDLIVGPIQRVDETLAIGHLESRGFWTEASIAGRRIRLPGLGYTLSRTPYRIGGAPAASTSEDPERPAATDDRSGRPSPGASKGGGSPLGGLRVIEFGWNWAGPMVGQILADHGAEVIKVETSHRQDYMRHWRHARAFFQNANRNKRSVTIDVSTAEGAALLRELARRSDVVFDNFAAGVLARHGLGYEELHAVKPDLVVLSMAMAGQTGPLKHLRGFAATATGFAGLEAAIGYPGAGPTGLPLIGLGDLNAAIQAVVAILVALRHRARTGEGQFIDLSQIEAATALVAEPLIRFQLRGEVAGPVGNAHPEFVPQGVYPASGDDRWIAITVRDDRDWVALAAVMGEPGWMRAAVMAARRGRLERRDEIDGRLAEWTRAEDRDRLAAALQAAGVPAAPVFALEEVLAHPYFVERGLETRLPDPSASGGEWRMVRTPWRLGRTPGEIRSAAPALGGDNDYVFRELLELEAEEIARLDARGVIA